VERSLIDIAFLLLILPHKLLHLAKTAVFARAGPGNADRAAIISPGGQTKSEGDVMDKDEALLEATERAERAEEEVARLKGQTASHGLTQPSGDGEAELRKDSMMAHLLDSLAAGKNIGHYGRLVFAMVARHFMPHEELLAWLMRDPDFQEGDAVSMLRQVEGRDYNPPRRDRLLEWQAQQEFPILPFPEDPDCGNLYRNLKFPDAIYSHISQYQEQKATSGSLDAG
jgi:hypothetical protein